MNVRACRLGAHAALFMRRHRESRVAAVFDRSLYLVSGDDFVCMGGPELGNGPLNLILNVVPGTDWSCNLRCDDVAKSKVPTRLHIGALAVDLSGVAEWRPPAWPRRLTADDMAAGVSCVVELARIHAPSDGLVRPGLGVVATPAPSPAFMRVAQPGLQKLEGWISRKLGASDSREPELPPTGLLGLGPGLTPSGDDLLCGSLITLHAIGRREIALELAAAVGRDARQQTTDLSRAFLRAAADGQGSGVLHETIAAILEGQRRELPSLVGHIGRIGHTSGWDALAGVCFVVNAAIPGALPYSTRSP